MRNFRVVKNLGLDVSLVETKPRGERDDIVVHQWDKIYKQAKSDLHAYETGTDFSPKYI